MAEKFGEKVCEYPTCSTIFFGTSCSKYCEEHRKRKYKFKLHKEKQQYNINEANIKIKHTNKEIITEVRQCDACGDDYTITIFPKVYVYSRFCDPHRNLHKRQLFYEMLNRE